ncbi:MAG TPA: VTT domain-containing protein [Verrucomicrobiae bacterium]|nr:VTT domain-containing protein [Verrucomicrobiae bacterium]
MHQNTVDHVLGQLARHGSLILLVVVFLEQIGLPLPGIPFLLAAGTLAGAGKLNVGILLLVAVAACLLADTIWFRLGQRRGHGVLKLLCRISLEPDSCVRRTEDVFTRHGMNAVLAGKFVPGVSTVAPPLAGIFGVSLKRFLVYDAAASVLYAGCFLLLGYFFSNQFQPVLAFLGSMGRQAIIVVLLLLVIYIGWKYLERQRVLRELRIARVTVDELRRMQEAGETVCIIDLRSELELTENPTVIAGARHIPPAEIEARHGEVPRDCDIVVYCSCPNEATAARVALMLRKRGIKRIRPLLGGFDAWREKNYPLDPHLPHPIPVPAA